MDGIGALANRHCRRLLVSVLAMVLKLPQLLVRVLICVVVGRHLDRGRERHS
jgi:hypothetical protein